MCKIFKLIKLNDDCEDTDDVLYYKSKKVMCDELNLTERLLHSTHQGNRTHHKGYRLAILNNVEYEDFKLEDYDIKDVINKDNEYLTETDDRDYSTVCEMLNKKEKIIQRLQDEKRISNKIKREGNREFNMMESLNNELIKLCKNNSIDIKTKFHTTDAPELKGIVQWSDLHGNENVDIIGNQYNWAILSKRIRKMTLENIKLFKSMGIKDILIAQTGDLLNSDRRLGEILTNATNRAKAIFILKDILLGSILEYNEHFNVSIASIIGNESRLDEDIHFEEQIASNNFDFVVNRLLFESLKDKEGIVFIPSQNPMEQIVDVCGQNILLLHGHTLRKPEVAIPRIKSKYADNGIIIRFVIYGHIHETEINSSSARSGSTVGNNAYSFYALHLSGRASQNSYIISTDGTINSIALDLQSVEGIEGYSFQDLKNSYNSKSLLKYKTVNNIFVYKI